MHSFIVVFISIFCISTAKCEDVDCKSKIDKGFGVGEVKKLRNDTESYCSYEGIPYVEPPVGDLRFEAPQRFILNETRVFKKLSEICSQLVYIRHQGVAGVEDCLYLNVYTPKTKKDDDQKYPVLFWVHGGSYAKGSSNDKIQSVHDFVKNGIIVVSINYRLDILGFLSKPEFGISGNFGLKDQVEALKWVQRNIASFGGDPEKVTLMGWSAGSAAATFHMYSESSKGLFHQVIAISGVMLNPWAFSFNPNFYWEKCLNMKNTTSKAELKQMDLEKLFERYPIDECKTVFNIYGNTYFVPSLETSVIDDNPYISTNEAPVNDVPLIIGYTSRELELFINSVFDLPLNPNIVNQNNTIKEAIRLKIIKTINRNNYSLAEFDSEANLIYGIRKFVHKLEKKNKSPIYFYQFEYEKEPNKTMFDKVIPYGANHGDDLTFLFAAENPDYGDEELLTLKRMVGMWSNFIKMGNPTPILDDIIDVKWEPYTESAPNYLNIDKDLRMMKEDFEENEYYKLWNKAFLCLYQLECDEIVN